MNKSVQKIILSLIVTMGVLGSSNLIVKAATNETNKLVQNALEQKTFYAYNVAYESIMKLNNTFERDTLLAKLSSITSTVWTSDVKKFNTMLDDLVKTKGSGKIYDEMEAQVNKSSLTEIDKAYLLGELTSWGKQLVYTDDYKVALDKLVKAWNEKKYISEAENAIKGVKNSYSKQYLSDELEKIKLKYKNQRPSGIDMELTKLLSKPFVDAYVRQVENPNLDAMVQSALNIAEGKDVDNKIKVRWDIKPSWNATALYTEHNDIVVTMDNPTLQDSYSYGESVDSFNYYQFMYRVVKWNSDIEKYEVHYITIGI